MRKFNVTIKDGITEYTVTECDCTDRNECVGCKHYEHCQFKPVHKNTKWVIVGIIVLSLLTLLGIYLTGKGCL